MRDSIIYSGDIESYDKLVRIYREEDHSDELLPYSIIMASKYEHTDAYYDAFYNLISLEGGISDFEINSINKDIRDIALTYFRKAIWKGHFAASRIMIDYYDETGLSPVKELYLNQELVKKAKNNVVKELN